MDPIFTLKCQNFKDEDKPFYYEFFYSTNPEGKDKKSLGTGLEDTRSKVTFSSGLEKYDYNLTLYATVSDGLGASTTIKFREPIQVS